MSEYGHRFGLWRFRHTTYGTGTFQKARKQLPLRWLPWKLLDAGPQYARRR